MACAHSGFPEDSFPYSVLVTYAVSDRVSRGDNNEIHKVRSLGFAQIFGS